MKNYYEVMGIDNFSSIEDVHSRFLFLTHAFHPDKFPDANYRNEAQEEFLIIKEAYDILGNKNKKADYDLRLKEEINILAKKNYGFDRPDYKKYSSYNKQKSQEEYQNINEDLKKENDGFLSNSLYRICLAVGLILIFIFTCNKLRTNKANSFTQATIENNTPTPLPTPTISLILEKMKHY
jgi:curved DNA-binding protein CbpA